MLLNVTYVLHSQMSLCHTCSLSLPLSVTCTQQMQTDRTELVMFYIVEKIKTNNALSLSTF